MKTHPNDSKAADHAEVIETHLLNIVMDAQVVFKISDAHAPGGEGELSDQVLFRCLALAAKSIEDSARQALELLDEG